MLLTNAPNYAIISIFHGILLLRIISNPITCNHLLNHILESMAHNPLDIGHDLYFENYGQGKFSIFQMCQNSHF